MNKPIDLQVLIDNKLVSNEWVHDWERRSALRALKKLNSPIVHTDLHALRQQVLQRKQELGHDKIRAILKKDILLSDKIAKLTTKLSGNRRQLCSIEIYSPTGTAEMFTQWFKEVEKLNREIIMEAALPEHWLILTHYEGQQLKQEVIETTGGSPLATRFFVDYNDQTGLSTQPDPTYPLQIAGVAKTADGIVIGGVRHQFRNEAQGFRAKLTVEFPFFTMPIMINEHRWHLACEFSNWILKSLEETNE